MLAFHGTPAIKARYLARVRAHRAADEIVRGVYWSNGRGCAVGCTIHGSDHAAYERELGIPMALARLEDTIHEMLPVGLYQEWPERFLGAIEPGQDLSRVSWQWLHWLVTGSAFDHPLVAAAVRQCADAIEPATRGGAAAADADVAEAAAWAAWAARAAPASAQRFADRLIAMIREAPRP